MLTDLKKAIATRLQPLSDRAKIVSDDSDGEAGTNSQVRADYIIRIGYSGTTFDPPPNAELIQLQTCNRSFQVAIEIRDFRNEDKTIALLEDTENLLLGHRLCVRGVTGEISLESDRFNRNENGIYFYVVNLSIPCVVLKG